MTAYAKSCLFICVIYIGLFIYCTSVKGIDFAIAYFSGGVLGMYAVMFIHEVNKPKP